MRERKESQRGRGFINAGRERKQRRIGGYARVEMEHMCISIRDRRGYQEGGGRETEHEDGKRWGVDGKEERRCEWRKAEFRL